VEKSLKLDTVREDKAILNVTTRLAETFAEIHDPEEVEVAVQAARRQFDGDPVREYVPILVERIVRKELGNQPDVAVNTAPDPENAKAEAAPAAEAQAAPAAEAQTEPQAEEASAGAESEASRLARWTGDTTAGGAPAAPKPTAPKPVSPKPAGSRPRRRPRKRVRFALPVTIAVVLVITALAATAIVRSRNQAQAQPAGQAALTTVHGVIGSEKQAFFDDPKVQAALAGHGLRVEVDPAGSREIATSVDLGKYDFAFPSSAPAAERIQQPSDVGPRVFGKKYTIFSSPMSIATYKPIADLLTKQGVAKYVGGIWTFDVGRYLALAASHTRWDQLKGNTTYPVRKQILVTTTDPRTSNSAAMYLSIVSYVANGDTVVQGSAAEKNVLPTVSRLFVDQGYTDSSSEGPFADYLSLGMGKTPMVCVYEAQFVDATVHGKLKPGMVLMYPSPTVLSKHTLLSRSADGDRIGQLLSSDVELQQLAAQHGFRTADPGQFAKVIAARKVPVAGEVIDVADTPTYDTLEHLLDGVSRSYR
jgi:hypothetical protein